MANDLYYAVAKAAAKKVQGRPVGEERMLVCWTKLGGGNEQAQIKQRLAQEGWDVIDFRDSKPVSSDDDAGDAAIRVALAEARKSGFAFIVFSRPPL
jgi:hypothetical protein